MGLPLCSKILMLSFIGLELRFLDKPRARDDSYQGDFKMKLNYKLQGQLKSVCWVLALSTALFPGHIFLDLRIPEKSLGLWLIEFELKKLDEHEGFSTQVMMKLRHLSLSHS